MSAQRPQLDGTFQPDGTAWGGGGVAKPAVHMLYPPPPLRKHHYAVKPPSSVPLVVPSRGMGGYLIPQAETNLENGTTNGPHKSDLWNCGSVFSRAGGGGNGRE